TCRDEARVLFLHFLESEHQLDLLLRKEVRSKVVVEAPTMAVGVGRVGFSDDDLHTRIVARQPQSYTLRVGYPSIGGGVARCGFRALSYTCPGYETQAPGGGVGEETGIKTALRASPTPLPAQIDNWTAPPLH